MSFSETLLEFSEVLEPQSLDLALGIQKDDLPLDSIGVESTQDDEMFIDQTYGLNLQETTEDNFGDLGRLNMAKSKSSLNNPFIIDDSSEENETMPIDGEGPQGTTGVNINRIRSAQQILLDGLKTQNSKHGPSSVSEAGNLVNGTGRSGQGWTPVSPTSIGDEVGGKENIAIYMRHDTTDNSWMEHDNNDTKEVEEIERLRKLEASLRRRNARNQLSEMEMYQLRRVTNELKLNKRRKEIAERYKEEPNDAMFVAETVIGGNSNGSGKVNGGPVEHTVNYEQPLWDPILNDNIKNKKRRKISRTAREVEEKRREKERGRKRRDRLALLNGSNKKIVTASKTKKAKSTKKVGKIPREYRSRMKEASGNDALEAMLGSLVYSDPIQERFVQEDFGLAPAIHERASKKRQMDALMSIIPNDYDIHKSTTQKSDLLRASRSFGYGKVVASDGMWKLKGMKSSLYHHQLLAAEWMVKRELGPEGPYGGLLADAMGLGKTLEVLAAMVGNPFSEKDAKNTVKGTLLVLPSSAIKQWETEIRLHAENHTFRKVIHYMSRMGIPLWALTEADIVLTSYSEVRNSFPFPSRSEMEACGGYRQWAESYHKSPGVLHQIEWYRIVLDEAHAIKNFKSRTSLACQKLNGRYRWAVSGTPIQNRLEELFSYFRFLRVDWASNYLTFRKQYCDPNAEDSRARMTVILSIIMRRTMKDEILSRPIVELPRTHPSMRFVSFSKEESLIYRTLERHFRESINRHFAQGTAQKNYSMFMVLLLRLRQCTAHPFLLENTVKQILSLGEISQLKAELKKLGQDKKPFYEQIEQWVPRAQEEQSGVLERGELLEESASFGRSDFGKHFSMDEYFDALHTKEARERVLCGICSDVVVDPQITDCNHFFCENCLMDYMHREMSKKDATDVTMCPTCKGVFSKTSPYTGLSLGTDGDAGFESQSIGPLGKKRGQFDPYPYETTWLSMYKQDKNNYLAPSAKTTAFKSQVLKWLSEAPNDKILVFTQFRMMAKLLGLIAEAENWGYVYYTGNMTFTHRHEVVTQFHSDPKIILMIAGLKCGGQALNLTCANRVISIDLWWNHSVEQQAFGRVFRIGQHKETHVTRIVVKNSVDQRLLDMQSEKVRAIDAALQDTGNVVEPLTIEELASLFGHLREGEDGKLRVEEDYDDDEADEGR